MVNENLRQTVQEHFLTEDYAQHRDLKDIARAAGLKCEVMSLGEFSDGFKLT